MIIIANHVTCLNFNCLNVFYKCLVISNFFLNTSDFYNQYLWSQFQALLNSLFSWNGKNVLTFISLHAFMLHNALSYHCSFVIHLIRLMHLIHCLESFTWNVWKIFRKVNVFHPLIRTLTFAYQEERNVSFSENFAHVLNGWSRLQYFSLLQKTMKKIKLSFLPRRTCCWHDFWFKAVFITVNINHNG